MFISDCLFDAIKKLSKMQNNRILKTKLQGCFAGFPEKRYPSRVRLPVKAVRTYLLGPIYENCHFYFHVRTGFSWLRWLPSPDTRSHASKCFSVLQSNFGIAIPPSK